MVRFLANNASLGSVLITMVFAGIALGLVINIQQDVNEMRRELRTLRLKAELSELQQLIEKEVKEANINSTKLDMLKTRINNLKKEAGIKTTNTFK